MFVKQRGRFSRQLRRCATAQELLCAREVLDNRIGTAPPASASAAFRIASAACWFAITAISSVFWTTSAGFCCPLDPDQMRTRPALESQIGSFFGNRRVSEFKANQFFAPEGGG